MKKKTIILLLTILTTVSGFTMQMATLSFAGDFPFYSNILKYFTIKPMSINQKKTFKISGTYTKPLRLRARVFFKTKEGSHKHLKTIPLTVRRHRFYLKYTCTAGPGIYSVEFDVASKRGKFHWMTTVTLFSELDPLKAAEIRFYNDHQKRGPLLDGYEASDKSFSIAPVPAVVKEKVRLKITIKKRGKYNIEILKREYGNVERIAHFPANFKLGTQTFDYYFKDGPGNYIVAFSQTTKTGDNSTRTMLDPKFGVKVTNPLSLSKKATSLTSQLRSFVKKNIGKKVGNGICGDLYGAYARGRNTEIMVMPMTHQKLFKLSPGKKLPKSLLKDFYSGNNIYEQYGQPIPAKDLVPGDLITMIDATWKENITYGREHKWSTGGMAHGAVVYKKLGGGKFLIAHQNIGGVKKVRITGIDLNRVKALDIKYIRLVRGLVPVK